MFTTRRVFRVLVAIGAGCALISACGGLPDDIGQNEIGRSVSAIVGGTADTTYTSVGILSGGPKGDCTATLVGRNTVLTAGHCISGGTTASAMRFVLDGTQYAVSRATPHPDYVVDETENVVKNDVGVITLSASPQDVGSYTPVPLAKGAPAKGVQLHVVGFGLTDTDEEDAGTRRMALNIVGRIDTSRYSLLPSSAADTNLGSFCRGDSGGPSFATLYGEKVQTGVHSFFIDAAASTEVCATSGDAYDYRVDKYTDWIAEVAGGDVELATQTGANNTETTTDATQNDVVAVVCNITPTTSPTPPLILTLLLLGLCVRTQRRFG